MSRATGAFFMIAGLMLIAACAAPAEVKTAAATPRTAAPATSMAAGVCAGFTLSIPPDLVGQASATEAAQSFVARGEEPGYPASGWRTFGHDELGVSLMSGGAKLHVVQLPNQTWVVDQGRRC